MGGSTGDGDYYFTSRHHEVPKDDLLYEAKEGNIDKVKKLLERGADVNKQGEDGWTALIWAANRRHPDVVKLLVEHGALVDVKTDNGRTALMEISDNAYDVGAAMEIISFLVKNKAEIDMRDKDGSTALMLAASQNDFKVVELLVKLGADLTIKDNNGETAAMQAKRNGYNDVAVYLDSLIRMRNEITNTTKSEVGSKNQLNTEFSNVLRRQ
ncbi:MAG: ankyrin repeat domain-containing protein [Candidatus Micrarchaeales archaeon]|jgi:FOG: Ankyrin repeat|uniref:Ankyrin repeat protein n=1 Tax=Candidatus Micrarchaeum acidiphilum ARMAN-2 TaxID=425595 RepID=C7DHI3_MICA2|nr:MAG: Ankyrin repeat protein [Candidatus Micrarchaeum acidiphilum ARMAN-2]MCW6160654.1 ankyrin repeat domain-containing protein [Candidatus Micrarchaeales archaeon]